MYAFKGEYAGGTAYNVGDVVIFTDRMVYWLAKPAPAGTPCHDTLYWQKMEKGITEVVLMMNDVANMTDAQVSGAVNAYLDGVITNPSSPPLDRTLLSASAAAPADMAGDIKRAVDQTSKTYVGTNLANPDKFASGYLSSNGTLTSSTSYRTTDYIHIENGESYAVGSYSKFNALMSGRYGYLLYNASKEPISADYANTDNISGMVITISDSSAKYMRCFASYATGRTIMVCKASSVPASSSAYEETTKVIAPLDSVPVAQIQALLPEGVSDALAGYEVPIIQTSQLFDRSKNTVGYCSNTGYIDSSSSYVYTEKIPVTVGKTIYFSVNGEASSARFVTAYNASDEAVSASGASSSVATYTVPEGITAVRFSYTNPESSDSNAKFAHFQAEYDGITGYVPYGKFFKIDDSLGKDNVLWGKKWAVCGDSFTAGVLNTTIQTGRYTGKKVVYPYLIGNRNNMEIVNFANGGQTLAYPATPSDFTNSLTYTSGERYYQNIPADVDYITIYLGINDAGYADSETNNIPLGEITDNTTATYYGAWNVVLSWLITNRPNAHIGIIVCNGNASKDTYRQAQIAVAGKYGIPYIDLNGDERTPAMLRTSNTNIASAVKDALIAKWRAGENDLHPNDDAHRFESTFIENFLRSI